MAIYCQHCPSRIWSHEDHNSFDSCDDCYAKLVVVNEMFKALAFARSVIKSGEPWTPTCEDIIQGVINKAKLSPYEARKLHRERQEARRNKRENPPRPPMRAG